MSSEGRPDPDGPEPQGPSATDRALAEMLEQWRTEDPEGFEAFMRRGGLQPHRQGSELRVRSPRLKALLVVIALALVVLVSPVPQWVVSVADTISGTPAPAGAVEAGAPVTVAPRPVSGGRLAPAVPIGGAPPADQYAFLNTQPGTSTPVTFDPCQPIHYVVRDNGVGEEGVQLVHDAVAEVSAATGLVFVFDGLTDEVPSDQRPVSMPGRYGPGYAPVLIAWSDPDEEPELDGSTAGLGGPVSVRGSDGVWTYVTGRVQLDAPQLAPDLGFLGRGSVRAVVMHEIAHVVGADHAADPAQLMAAEHRGQRGWEDGDRYALAVLGQGPCGS